MPDIQLQCSYCGAAFSVSEDQGGLLVVCPECRRQVKAPLVSRTAESKPSLQIKHDHHIDGTTKCLSCGAGMPVGAVLCVQCGYHVRTGARVGDPEPRSLAGRIVWWAVGLVILGGLYYSFFKKSEPAPAPPAATVVNSSATPTVETVVAVAAPVSTAETAATTTVPPTNLEAAAVSNAPALEAAAREEELRSQLLLQMDQRLPLYEPGSSVALRRFNGMVHRGTFSGVEGTNVVLGVGTNKISIPLLALDQASRLRCDPVFRGQWLDYSVKKQLKSMQKP